MRSPQNRPRSSTCPSRPSRGLRTGGASCRSRRTSWERCLPASTRIQALYSVGLLLSHVAVLDKPVELGLQRLVTHLLPGLVHGVLDRRLVQAEDVGDPRGETALLGVTRLLGHCHTAHDAQDHHGGDYRTCEPVSLLHSDSSLVCVGPVLRTNLQEVC